MSQHTPQVHNDVGEDRARKLASTYVEEAIDTIVALMRSSKSETLRRNCAKDIIDISRSTQAAVEPEQLELFDPTAVSDAKLASVIAEHG